MIEQLYTISHELSLVLLAGVTFSLGLVWPSRRVGRMEAWATVLGLSILLAWSVVAGASARPAFGGAYYTGPVELLFKQLFLAAGILMTLLSWPGNARCRVAPLGVAGEYLGLMLLSLAGMCFLVAARELILLYVGLELVTIPLILLVAFNRHELRSAEAALKYVLFSALSSGFLLYGLSLIYGVTGTTYLADIGRAITWSPLMLVALVLVLGGVGFKITAVPFHLWAPDTYEGAPIPVAAFLSVASKAAGFALFYKLITGMFGQFTEVHTILVALVATATMTFGNLTALHQTNLKRFLAYSSIAQAGYLMLGLTQQGDLGLASVLYYLWVYLFSNVAAFSVVTIIAAATGNEDVRGYAGLSESNPALALAMMLAMFSLAGIPPLAGFLGKFYLFAAAAKQGLYWLVFVGSVNATVSLYYYLVVVKWMYIAQPAPGQPGVGKIEVPWAGAVALGAASAAVALIGILPQAIRWTEQIASAGF